MTIESSRNETAAGRIRLGMVGGGEGAFIGAVHRIAARIDDRYTLVAGALSSDAERARRSAEGLGIALAPVVPATTVPESTLSGLWMHELRWGRTIRALAPIGFTLAAIQYPLLWAAVSMVLAGGAAWSIGAFLLAWAVRALAARGIDRALGLAIPAPVWLLPLRDLLSFAVTVASFLGDRVEWRGHALAADHGRSPAGEAAHYPVEDEARSP